IAESEISNNESTRYGAILSYKLGGTLRIEDSSISQNRGGSAGGMNIQYPTTVELVRSTIKGNTGFAGGIFNGSATLNIDQSTISSNEGSYVGGISNSGGTLNLNASTISGNTARGNIGSSVAGGLLGSAHLVNSTISGNLVDAANLDLNDPYFGASVAGGWNASSGDNSMENSTIAFNRVINAPAAAAAAGGVVGFYYSFEYYGYQYAGSADIQTRNTLIARNEVNAQPKDVWGRFVSGGHNLVGVLTPDATGFVPSDLRGTAARPLDPRLSPLANNGGATQTHRLNLFSPAINAGDNSGVPATDQRGFKRIALGVVDIGAYEFLSFPQRTDCALTSLLEDFDRRKGLLSGLLDHLVDQIASRLVGMSH
ncbi:MAG: choice-of-anchor Q domain-containing protein, partial [Aureliella sp.]